jgi:hypothetical protein
LLEHGLKQDYVPTNVGLILEAEGVVEVDIRDHGRDFFETAQRPDVREPIRPLDYGDGPLRPGKGQRDALVDPKVLDGESCCCHAKLAQQRTRFGNLRCEPHRVAHDQVYRAQKFDA